jgi:hypothetical protein
MTKTKDKILEKVCNRLVDLYKKISNADWSDPKNILILIACVIMPFVAWYYISTGFVMGLMMAISILWLLEKSPVFIKEFVCDYPLAADILLSTLAVMTVGGYFGTGLTLGLGAVFATVILSWALPSFAEKHRKQHPIDPQKNKNSIWEKLKTKFNFNNEEPSTA